VSPKGNKAPCRESRWIITHYLCPEGAKQHSQGQRPWNKETPAFPYALKGQYNNRAAPPSVVKVFVLPLQGGPSCLAPLYWGVAPRLCCVSPSDWPDETSTAGGCAHVTWYQSVRLRDGVHYRNYSPGGTLTSFANLRPQTYVHYRTGKMSLSSGRFRGIGMSRHGRDTRHAVLDVSASPTCPHSHEIRPVVGISEMAPTRNHKGRLST